MTALTQYQRLESTGLWRDRADAQRREVIVNFGDASLIISDPRGEVPIAHWSLPAVVRVNPNEVPAIYAPGTEVGETLELADETMVAAIEKVHRLIEARKPHPGRLRSALLGGAMVAVLALSILFLPGALVRHTVSVVPPEKREEIGLAVLTEISRISGQPCTSGAGQRSLARLTERLLGPGKGMIVVLPGAVTGARHLPGSLILLGRDLVEDYESPEVAAGHILAEKLQAEASDPLADLLHWAGTRATFRLLTTGALSDSDIDGYGEYLLATPRQPVSDEALLARFKAAEVASTPYAYALDVSGETVLGLIEADPFATEPSSPVLADGDWVALQGICGS